MRILRRIGARVLPEALKGPLRGRLYGYRATAEAFGLAVEDAADGGGTARTRDGFSLAFPPAARDDVLFHFERNGESVEEMHALLRAARDPGGLLWDVGAHHGLFSHVFCAAGATNRAVAFEPSPGPVAVGREMAARNGIGDRVDFRGAALGEEPGTLDAWAGVHGFFQTGPAPDGAGTFRVEVTTLDAELARSGEAPAVLKVDVEGFEGEVLRGGARLLREHRPLVLLELHLDLLEARGIAPADAVAPLRAAGYRFESLRGAPMPAARIAGSLAAVTRVVAR